MKPNLIIFLEIPQSMSNATRTFVLRSLLLFPNYNLAKCVTDYSAFYQMKKWCALENADLYLNCDKESECLGAPKSLGN